MSYNHQRTVADGDEIVLRDGDSPTKGTLSHGVGLDGTAVALRLIGPYLESLQTKDVEQLELLGRMLAVLEQMNIHLAYITGLELTADADT